jgi:hypothetical protein
MDCLCQMRRDPRNPHGEYFYATCWRRWRLIILGRKSGAARSAKSQGILRVRCVNYFISEWHPVR